ncbi:hypothetical protein APR04_002817 [Promicromonospora umidemergens]|uniref:Uncharacterized protein n=1 Tax=Promicromonospora umidemergens TaxID=629679 RepID=A0ABP8WJ16_9MICO|nr:hypothetical protein [Promicromonospora umidemergens]MCP2283904.1 hypothetical protein [Promicromonospora umidemergens]
MFTTADREALRDSLVAAAQADADVAAAARWTDVMYGTHGAAHHLDVVADGVLYRVFLLAGSLQVDVSFWPYERFRETQRGDRLLFGDTNPPAIARGRRAAGGARRGRPGDR